MRGIVYDGTATKLVDNLKLRDPGPREVVVKMAAAGLCHSDVSFMTGLYAGVVPAPAVCGHEGAGIVDKVGSAVTHVQEGDHILIATLASCGLCKQCGDGQPARCRASIGAPTQPFSMNDEPVWNFASTSAFGEYTLVRDTQCVKIADDVPLTSAALVGCGVVTGMGAVFNRANVRDGDAAVVFGVGGVGLNVLQALKVQGASTIIAVDTEPKKEVLARQFGATHFLDGKAEDIVEQIAAIRPYSDTQVRGPFNAGGMDWAFDVVAHPQVTMNALESLDWGGTCVVIGVPAATAEYHGIYTRLTQVDRGLVGTRAGSYSPHRDMPFIIDLYRRGLVKLDELVSATYPLEDFETVIHEMEGGNLARGVLTF